MRRIIRNYKDRPRILTLSTTEKNWLKVALSGDSSEIKPNLYSDPYHDSLGNTASRVIDKLNTWYIYKCAYCERIYKMDVEHYRPKGEVRDENNQIVTYAGPGGLAISHPGYFWLCYEWSNLLPACISCNRDGGKTSKFPTRTKYNFAAPIVAGAIDKIRCFVGHIDLTSEDPYLLHPELDIIDGVFKFKIDDQKKGIEIEGNDPLNRGKMTIELCQMNRPEIRISRLQSVVYPIRKHLIALMKQLAAGRQSLAETKNSVNTFLQKLYDDRNDETMDHTYLRKYIVYNQDQFESIVIPFIPQPMQKIFIAAYINYSPI